MTKPRLPTHPRRKGKQGVRLLMEHRMTADRPFAPESRI
jgi:hypothetical protein